jgi:hypothetical protein
VLDGDPRHVDGIERVERREYLCAERLMARRDAV